MSDNGSHDSNPTSNGATGSGISSGSLRFAVVPSGTSAPTAYAAYTYSAGINQDFSSLGVGSYDVYAVVKDNAGNISGVAPVSGQIVIKNTGSNQPTITGAFGTATEDKNGAAIAANSTYTSGAWSNVAIDLTGSKGTGNYSGIHNVDIVSGGSTIASGSGGNGANVTAGVSTEGKTTYSSVVVNAALPKAALSNNSGGFHVWVDTQAPITSISSSDNWLSNTDVSTDDTALTSDVSGVYKTYVNFVPAGTLGVNYNTSGWKDHASASLTTAGIWDVYAYTIDHAGNKSAVAVVDTGVIVASTLSPVLSATYRAGATDKDGNPITAGTVYDGAWTNDSVDLMLQTTDLASGLYGVLYHGGTQFSSGAVIAQKYLKGGYSTESTGAMGTDLTGKVALNAVLTGLSPVSNTLNVKIDTIAPITGITANIGNATFSDASTDDKSGVYKTMVAYVAKNAAAPAAGTYAEISTVNITTPGEYDIWAYTIDEAGNRSTVAKQIAGVKVVSNTPAELKAAYNDNGTVKNYIPGTWINKDIILTASKPSGFNYTGNYNSAVYYNTTAQFGKGTDNAGGDYTYTSNSSVVDETVFALLVDDSNAAVSAPSASMTVKVDKIAPTAAASMNASWQILDQSTDAHSGIDSSKTQIAIVPHGSPAPGISAFSPLSGQTVPATGLYYDIYLIVYDNAGNTSGVKEVLGNRSTNPKDEITASDLERGLNQGILTDADTRGLSDAAGNYYTTTLPVLPITQSDITVDGPMLSAINSQIISGKLGTYDLQFATPTTTPPRPLTSANPAYSEQADVKVKLYQYGAGTPGTTELIYANDFTYSVKNGSIDDNRAKTLAAVFAREANLTIMNRSNVQVDQTELSDINAAIAAGDVDHNTWPLTFRTPDGTAVTVQASLFDHVTPDPVTPGEEMIAANDFAFGMDQGALTDNVTKFLSNVLAKDGAGNAIPSANISVDAAELTVINDAISAGDKSGNPFDLSFETTTGKRVTVKVTLYDHSNPPVVNQALIVGDDFRYAIPNGAISTNQAKELAKAAAKDGNGVKIPVANIGVDGIELTAINAAIAAGTRTTLPLTFDEPSGERVTVNVTLYQNGPVPPTPNEEEIFANDFSYGISSGAISADAAKTLSQVYAHYVNGANINRNDIHVDTVELAAINARIAAGDKSGNPYPLTFLSPNGKQVTVEVTLKDNGPITPPASGKEHITGNDFFFGMDQGALSDAAALALAQTDARNADGSAMNPASVIVDPAELGTINTAITAGDRSNNPFDLTFTTPDGTSTTVKVTLYDHSNPPAANQALIVGNDFSYGMDQGSLDDDTAKAYAQAMAVDGNGDPINVSALGVNQTELGVINAAIAAGDQSGNPFPLTFDEPSGQTVTVMVTLKDHGAGSVVPGNPATGSDRITANDFIYGINEGALTSAESMFRSQVTATDRDGKLYPLSALTTSTAELAAINSKIIAGQTGSYPMTYTTPDGTSVTVQVILRDQAARPTPDLSDPGRLGSGNIGANDFVASSNNPAPLSDQDARDEAQALAKDKFGADFPSASIHVDATELAAINSAKAAGTIGDYPLTFTSSEGKSVTVTVSLRATHTITLNYVDRQGNTVKASETETVVPGTYTKTAPTIAEKVFVDWSKDAISPMANLEGNTTINISNVTGDMTLTLVYGQDKGGSGPDGKTPDGIEDFTITEQYIGNGAVIAGNTERYINRGTTYVGSPLKVSGYIYTGYQVNGGVFQRGTAPVIANVQTTHTVTMHYAVNTPTQPPAKPDDKGNYNFIKRPNVKNVAAGQTIGYTFSNFGNNWGVPLERYAISDLPDKGLDFVSATLPAFKNGAGVTYDVVYSTNRQSSRILHKDIPADKSFDFRAPSLQKGEYITALSLEFGTVPAGFAVGDTIKMNFKVWNNPPAKTLTNVGLLSYRVNGKDRQFVSGGPGSSIIISGYFDAPKTGDYDNMMLFVTMLMLATGVISQRKLRKRKEQY